MSPPPIEPNRDPTRIMNSRPLSILFAVCLTATCLHAVELRFLATEGTEESLKFTSHGKIVPIRADENSLSPAYVFEDAGPLLLFKEVVNDRQTVHVPAATLTVPAGLTHAIVVLTATATPGAYAGVWIDDSPTARAAGTIRLVNFSKNRVTVRIDTAGFTLAPSETQQVSVTPGVTRVSMQAEVQTGDRREPVAGNPIPMRPGLRLLLILRDGRPQLGAQTNLVDMLSFYDRPPAPRTEAPPPAAPAAATAQPAPR